MGNWKEKLKAAGIDEDLLSDIEEEFSGIVENRLKKDRARRGDSVVDGDKITELESRVAEYEKLMKLDSTEKDRYEKKIANLQREIESVRISEREQMEKSSKDLQTELEITRKKFETLRSQTKRDYISQVLNRHVSEMKLDKPKVAVDWLMYKGYLDAEEKFNEDGTFAGFTPKSRPISYTDPETKVEIKDRVFSGEDKLGDFFKVAYNVDPDFRSSFSVLEDVPRGSGTSSRVSTGGPLPADDNAAIAQLIQSRKQG